MPDTKETRQIEVSALGIDDVVKEFNKLSKTIRQGTIIPRETHKSYKTLEKQMAKLGESAQKAGKKGEEGINDFSKELINFQKRLEKSGKAASLGLQKFTTFTVDRENFKEFGKLIDESVNKIKKVGDLEGLLSNVNNRMEKLTFSTKEFPMELRKVVRGFAGFSSMVSKIDISTMSTDDLKKYGNQLNRQVGLYDKVTGGLDTFIRAQQALGRVQSFGTMNDDTKRATIALEQYNKELIVQIKKGNQSKEAFTDLTKKIDRTRRSLDLINFKRLVDESNKLVDAGLFDPSQKDKLNDLNTEFNKITDKMAWATKWGKKEIFDELSKDAEAIHQQMTSITAEEAKQVGLKDKLAALDRTSDKEEKKDAKRKKLSRKELVKEMKVQEKGDKKKLGFFKTAFGWNKRRRVSKAIAEGKSDEEIKEAKKGGVRGLAKKGAIGGVKKLGGGIGAAAGVVAAPALAVAGFAGMAAALLDMNAKVKGARRDLSAMGMETGELFGKSAGSMIRQSEVWRRQLTDTGQRFAMTMDEVYANAQGFTKEGFEIGAVSAKMGTLITQSASLNISVGELANIGGNIREEFGGALDTSVESIIKLKDQAKGTGLTITRFLGKVMNAASGMGLYRGKIDEVSKAFAGMARSSSLPEKVASEAIGKLVTGTKDLDVGMQHIIGQTPHMKKVADALKEYKDAAAAKDVEAMAKANKKLTAFGIDKHEIETINSMNDGYNKNIALVRAVSAERSNLGRIEAMTRTLLPGFDITADNAADKLGTAMSQNIVEFEKMGEQFGMDRAMIEVIKDWSVVVKQNQAISKGLGLTMLKATMSKEDREAAIANNVAKMGEKTGSDLYGYFDQNTKAGEAIADNLKMSHADMMKKLTDGDAETVANVKEQIAKSETSFENSDKVMTAVAAKQKEEEDKRVEQQRRHMTKSIMEAIELALQRLIEKIYLVMERVWSVLSKFLPPIIIALKRGFAWLIKVLSFGNKKMQDFASKLEYEAATGEAEHTAKKFGAIAENWKKKVTEAEEDVKAMEEKKAAGHATEADVEESKKKLATITGEAKVGIAEALKEQKKAQDDLYHFRRLAGNKEKRKEYTDLTKEYKKKKKIADKSYVGKGARYERTTGTMVGGMTEADVKEKKWKAQVAKVAIDNLKNEEKTEELVRQRNAKIAAKKKKGNLKEKKKDFYDIMSGGFVNVQTGDVLIDKNSLARGMSGSPGTALPSLTSATGDGDSGIGKQINNNQQITINVNQKDADAIKRIILNTMYDKGIG